MHPVRIYGDPFCEGPVASRMRSFLRFATGSGLQCGLSLGGLEARSVLPGEQVIPLTDGVRDFRIGTRLPPAEIELLLKSANEAVAATAPVVVFAAATEAADAVQMAGLEWPQATAVLLASDAATASELVDRVRAELRWAGVEASVMENGAHAFVVALRAGGGLLPRPPGPSRHPGGVEQCERHAAPALLQHLAGQPTPQRVTLRGHKPQQLLRQPG